MSDRRKRWPTPLATLGLVMSVLSFLLFVGLRVWMPPPEPIWQLTRDMLPEGQWYYTPGVGWRCPAQRMCRLSEVEGRVGIRSDER